MWFTKWRISPYPSHSLKIPNMIHCRLLLSFKDPKNSIVFLSRAALPVTSHQRRSSVTQPNLGWKYCLTEMWQENWDATRLQECRMCAEVLWKLSQNILLLFIQFPLVARRNIYLRFYHLIYRFLKNNGHFLVCSSWKHS